MDLGVIQFAASAIAVATAILYVIGGSIVNINLAKYRITELQFSPTLYLAVGLYFLLYLLLKVGVALLAGLLLGASTLVFDGQGWSFPQIFVFLLAMVINALLIIQERSRWRWLNKLVKVLRI